MQNQHAVHSDPTFSFKPDLIPLQFCACTYDTKTEKASLTRQQQKSSKLEGTQELLMLNRQPLPLYKVHSHGL